MRPLIVIAGLAAALSAPAHAQAVAPKPPVGQQTSSHYRAAYALAQELRDRDSMLIQLAHVFTESTMNQLAVDPQMGAAEKRYPGLINAMLTAARPEIENAIAASLPALWKDLADLFAAEMTDQEIAATMDYYTSPSGRRFKAIILKNYNYNKELASAGPNFDKPLDAETIKSAVKDAIPATVADMSMSDKASLEAFSRTPAFAKLRTLNSRILEIVTAWGNSPNPEGQAKVGKAMAATAERFVADAKTKKQ